MEWSEQHKKEWPLLVGTTMLAFSDIESVTYDCLAVLPSDKIAESLSHLKLGQRIDLINAIIDSRDFGEEGKHFKKLLIEAKNSSQMRNLIAHNPLALEIYANHKGAVEYRHVIASLKNDMHYFDKVKLADFSKSAQKLATELLDAWMEVRKAIDAA